MTMVPPNASDAGDAVDTQALLTRLRRKEGDWVEWGQACQTLQKSGFNPQKIFEETGFEPIQQNQIIVAMQVFQSMVAVGVEETTKAHFQHRGSDSLYELRILSQTDRAKTAEFVLKHGLDSDEVRDIVKPIKEYSYLKESPEGFSDNPGDAVAFHYWKLARQKSDLQERSRLIAQGLRYVHSSSARQQIEKLLMDFSVVKSRPAPTLPLYRLESETELPRILPVVGELPLTVDDVKAVPLAIPEEPFGLVKFSGTGAWVAVPGWQVILQAEDPIALLAKLDQLPNVSANASAESVLVIVDRAQREWKPDGYFLTEQADQVTIDWFEEKPGPSLLGRVILVMRPKKILDEGYTRELWQIDE
ncbi:MAG: hypothetical protein ICV62_06840 [Cyanobacteria bacterium Co-bin13]|nr:hypothetical protein [Cyanobacteria bacterium Co-bin13]